MTTRSHVEYRITTLLDNLSWHAVAGLYGGPRTASKQMRVWAGVRFRNADDQELYGAYDPEVNLPDSSSQEGFTSGSSEVSAAPPAPAPGTAEPGTAEPSGTSPEEFAEGSSTSVLAGNFRPPGRSGAAVTESNQNPEGEGRPAAAGSGAGRPCAPAAGAGGPQSSRRRVRRRWCCPAPWTTPGRRLRRAWRTCRWTARRPGTRPATRCSRLRTVQLGGEHLAAVLDPADPEQAAVIRDLLARAVKLHAHSAIADLVPLAAAGLGDIGALWAKMEDSVLIVKLGDPSLAGSDENELKKLSRRAAAATMRSARPRRRPRMPCSPPAGGWSRRPR